MTYSLWMMSFWYVVWEVLSDGKRVAFQSPMWI